MAQQQQTVARLVVGCRLENVRASIILRESKTRRKWRSCQTFPESCNKTSWRDGRGKIRRVVRTHIAARHPFWPLFDFWGGGAALYCIYNS